MKQRLLVLGSGVCGLAAALQARKNSPETEVIVLEAEEKVGGLARSLTVGGLVADMGPHRIHTELEDVREFLQSLAGESLVRVARKSRMWIRNRWIEYPPRPFEVLRVFGPVALAKCLASWTASRLSRFSDPSSHSDNFENVMTAAFGAELYRLIVLDYTEKVWKVPPDRIHGDIARVRVSAGGMDRLIKRVLVGEKPGTETALKHFLYIHGGVEKLATAMHEDLEKAGGSVELSKSVTSIQRESRQWIVGCEDGTKVQCDRIISTVPVSDLVSMLLPIHPCPQAEDAAGQMRFIANFLVCVVVSRPTISGCQWLYFPGSDTVFNRGYEPARFSAEMGGKDRSLLVLETTCHEGDRIWNSTDQQLVEETLKGLEQTGLVKGSEVLETHVHRIPKTYPLYDLGYRERVDTVLDYLAGFPGLVTTGRQGLFLHNNMDHSIHMGFRAADAVLGDSPEDSGRTHYRDIRRFQQFRIVD